MLRINPPFGVKDLTPNSLLTFRVQINKNLNLLMAGVGLVLPSSFRECDLFLFYWFIEQSVP